MFSILIHDYFKYEKQKQLNSVTERNLKESAKYFNFLLEKYGLSKDMMTKKKSFIFLYPQHHKDQVTWKDIQMHQKGIYHGKNCKIKSIESSPCII